MNAVIIVFCIITVGISGYFLFRIIGYYRKQVKELNNIRLNLARDLHDEVGATLSSINFYSEAAKMKLQAGDSQSAVDLSLKIGQQARNTIYSLNDIVWMINPGNDTLGKLFERIDDFGSSLFVPNGKQFIFYSDPELVNFIVPLEHRKNLFLIVKEALNNAAKYSLCNTAELLINKSGRKIQVVIKDDGVGMSEKIKGEGNGLLNMKVRANDMGSKLIVESAPGRGTVITFMVPVPPIW